MPSKPGPAQRERVRQHYRQNPQYYVDKARKRAEAIRSVVDALKARPCADCGVEYPPYVMDFDHLGDQVKVDAVAKLIRNANLGAILAEIEKCEVVCANCHRERTHQRRRSSMERAPGYEPGSCGGSNPLVGTEQMGLFRA